MYQVKSTVLDEKTDGYTSIMPYLKEKSTDKPKKVVPKAQRESIRRMLEISEKGMFTLLVLFNIRSMKLFIR